MYYLYYCQRCNKEFEVKKTIADSGRQENCPQCGNQAIRKYVPLPFSFGWRLTDRSLYGGLGDPKDEIEKAI